MKKILLSILIIFMSNTLGYAQWKEQKENFQTMPVSVRPNPLWFWNDTEIKKEELIRQMIGHKESGYGGLSILPFGKNFKPSYLTKEYFDMYRMAIEEAEKLGISLWIYDEYGFPSGTAGDINGDGFDRFRHKYPEHTNKRLDKTEYMPEPGSVFSMQLPEETLMAVVAMDTVTFQRIDLEDHISTNKLRWPVPDGNWKIMAFTCVNDGNSIVDYMSPEAVSLYINMTHYEYYKRFGKYFGNVIKGTFFDEPTLYYAQGRSWTPAFNEKFNDLYGFSPAFYYPALWYDIGDETEEARNYLFGFRSQLYAEGYTKQVNDWSVKHGVLATGHQDNEEMVNPVGTSGDFMKCFQYLEIPGIDKIGGNRPAEKYYKLVSSAAYNWDHSLVMSETYGDRGNISWDEIFSIAMDQYAKGINLLIPHAVWYNDNNVVFKPELSYRNPIYADSLKIFNDYLSRLNALMQNDAGWQGEIAVLYPIHTLQSGHYMDGPLGHYKGGVEIPDMDYVDVGVALIDSLGMDYLFIHPEVFDGKCKVDEATFKLDNKIQNNTFSVMIIPGCKTVSLSNLEKIKQLADNGATIIFTTSLLDKATFAKEDSKVRDIIKQLFPENSNLTSYGQTGYVNNVHFISKPNPESLQTVLQSSRDNFTLWFTGTDRVRNIHKILNGKNCWFFANPEDNPKNITFTLKGSYHNISLWDPHTGEISKLTTTQSENNLTNINLKIDAVKSIFLVEE